jgi:hypothetical protein
MLETHLDRMIVWTAVVLWFAISTYLNVKLERVHAKLDDVLEQFNGLRDCLYEIDPQFDDERRSNQELADGKLFAGWNDMELLKRKKSEGKRTLATPFWPR